MRMDDKKPFEEIFQEYYSPLCNYALKLVNDFEVAEEIVQDLFVQLLEKQTLDEVVYVDRFLIRSVKFKCIDFLRRRKNAGVVTFEHLAESDLIDNEELSGEEINALFHYLAAKLPPKTREVFLLVRQSELSYKETAEKLNISVKTVENQMSRALKKMNMFLKAHGYLSSLFFFL